MQRGIVDCTGIHNFHYNFSKKLEILNNKFFAKIARGGFTEIILQLIQLMPFVKEIFN